MDKSNLLQRSTGFNRCVHAREGYVLYNPNDIYIGQAIEAYGEYGEIEAQLLRQLCPQHGCVVEVGANIGTHTLVLAKSVGVSGWVIAYEAQRVVLQTLCANLALNSMVQVDARHAAVGARSGFVPMPDIDYSLSANFGGVELSAFSSGRPVRLVRLDEEIETQRLDLIKIDVEGMESEVITGAIQLIERHRPLLYVENDRVANSEALIHLILQLGYRLYWHLPRLFNPDNFFSNPTNLYPSIVSVNMLCLPRERAQNIHDLSEVTSPTEHPFHRSGVEHPSPSEIPQ